MQPAKFLAMLLASALPLAAAAQTADVTAVSGDVTPLNDLGQEISGTVSLAPQGDDLVITLNVEGAAPGMHLAHVHGFATREPDDATCPDMSADANGDGVVDLIETREAAGVTMIPFTDTPASLEINADTYPEAGQDGRLSYAQTVPIAQLRNAVEATFGTQLALDRRVVFIHGAPDGAELPDSVQSLEGVPARVTVPVACAELVAAES
jgi:hypothetical protein